MYLALWLKINNSVDYFFPFTLVDSCRHNILSLVKDLYSLAWSRQWGVFNCRKARWRQETIRSADKTCCKVVLFYFKDKKKQVCGSGGRPSATGKDFWQAHLCLTLTNHVIFAFWQKGVSYVWKLCPSWQCIMYSSNICLAPPTWRLRV